MFSTLFMVFFLFRRCILMISGCAGLAVNFRLCIFRLLRVFVFVMFLVIHIS